MSRSLTISQIAEEAGFSRSTVGHVLNGRATELRISQRTCEHILEVARRHNYVANPLAAGLRGGRTRAIGVLWSLGGPHANESLIRPLTLAIKQHECVSYIFDHMFDRNATPDAAISILENLRSRGADGVVMQLGEKPQLDHPRVAELIRAFPLRVLVALEPIAFDADIIIHDRLAALRDATTYLLESGRRRLVYASGFLDVNRYKAAAVEETVKAFGHGATVKLLDFGDIPAPHCDSVLDRSPAVQDADALLFSVDEYALAAMSWIHQTGRRCPEDVAVVGFNDSEFAQLLRPQLASVDRVHQAVVDQIKQVLADRMATPDANFQNHYVPMRFIPRQSAFGPANSNPHTSP